MNMKNNKGFSLVELIVVIAIMAVLAAVAVIGVSIYIPKAQEAADNELLNVLGDALRTACLSEGVDPSSITATIAVDAEGKLEAKADGTVNLVIRGTSKQDKLLELFNQIFTEKNAVTKKPMGTQLKFNGKTFGWNTASSNPSFSYGEGGTIVLDQADIDSLQGTTYLDMGMESLMGQLDQVTDIIAELNVDQLDLIKKSDDFLRCAAEALGIVADNDLNPDWKMELSIRQKAMVEEIMAKEGIGKDAAMKKFEANATVLYTAKLTAGMKDDEIAALLDNPDQTKILGNLTGSTPTDGLAQAGLLCGLYTAYVNQEGYEGDNTVNVETVLNALENDDGFRAFIADSQNAGSQSAKDLAGYKGSMNMISGGMSPDAVEELMVNGFADQNLINGLNSSIGSSGN